MKLPILFLTFLISANINAQVPARNIETNPPVKAASLFNKQKRLFLCREINTLNAPLGTRCETSVNITYERVLVYKGKRYFEESSNYSGDTSELYGWKVVSSHGKTVGFVWSDPVDVGKNYWDKKHCQIVADNLRVPSKAEYQTGFAEGIDEVLPGSDFSVFWTSDFIPDTTGYRDQPMGYRYTGKNRFSKTTIQGQYSGMDADIRCLRTAPPLL